MGLGGRHELLSEEYWSWAAASLYLLLTVDLLTSIYATSTVGVGAEANPMMGWLLTQPLWLIVSAHLLATVLAALGFYWLRATLQRAPAPVGRYFSIAVQAWLGGLIAVGLAVFANNLSVIVYGRGLFG